VRGTFFYEKPQMPCIGRMGGGDEKEEAKPINIKWMGKLVTPNAKVLNNQPTKPSLPYGG